MKNVSQKISERTGNAELLNTLENLPGTELNSILLEVFRKKVGQLSPPELLTNFEKNRFSKPSSIDPIAFKELEIKWLKFIENRNFTPIQLSPLAPLGSCAVFETVDQNNIVSALRGIEVMSDATNIFALLIAQHYKNNSNKKPIKYVTTERLVRGQAPSMPGHTAHFGIMCMATGGVDNGSFLFETEHLLEHLDTHLSLLSDEFNKEDLFIKIYLKEDNILFANALYAALENVSENYKVEIIQQEQPNNYYKLVQFKVFLNYNGTEINISDGGFVDWTQKVLSNKKLRLLISGSGLELVYKMIKGLI